ncbi:hypothetical protein NQ317_004119 [Molorchus minor]|uniref:Acyltransferase n=1 Tax=Molorchus minor TaxID=1323400 RepID=A0ABQ9J3D2_9CUCU|nr:hypothetical protein NQ317_004119 [Molorchus minor]
MFEFQMELFGIKFAPLFIPLERRLQTLAAAAWLSIVLLGTLVGTCTAIFLIVYTKLRWVTIIYLVWIWFIDKDTPEVGGRKNKWIKSSPWWRYLRDYFPVQFRKLEGVVLDPKKNYLFCSFPHGMYPIGVFCSLAIDYRDGVKFFPHHTVYGVTLSIQFYVPFSRDIMLALGLISSSAKSIDYVLSRPGGGNVCVLVVGGAGEAFYCKPGVYKLNLKNRKGFVKLALRNGTPMVPVFSFGETDVYDQVEGPRLRRIQEKFKKWIGVVPIVLLGRGFFQYSFGLLPRRRPITTVVGEPIDVPKIEDPTKEVIDEYHNEFIEKLTELFEKEKYKYLEKPEETNLIIV